MGGILTRMRGRTAAAGGGGAPFGSHAYWKVISRTNGGGGFTQLSELTWLDGSGSTISVSGATHTGSTVQAGSFANLFDASNSTFYQTSTLTDAFVQTQFASPVGVAGVKMATHEDTTRAPFFFDVYSSDDGSSYTYAFSGHYSSWALDTLVTFQAPAATGAMDYWVAVFTTINGGSALTLSEMELRTSVGGTDVATGGTAVRSSRGDFSFGEVANLFDDNTGTLCSQNPFIAWTFLGYHLASAQSILEVGLRARSSFLNQSPTAGTILAGTDGRTFVRRKDFSGLSWPSDLYLNLIAI